MYIAYLIRSMRFSVIYSLPTNYVTAIIRMQPDYIK